MTTSLKKLQRASDAALVRMFKRGSNSAFEILLKRYDKHLRKYMRTLLHNTQDEKDAMQQVWIYVVEHLRTAKYAEQGHFAQWLNTIVFRTARSFYKKQKPEAVAEIIDRADEHTLDENYQLVYEKQVALLKMNIDKLNSRQRILVQLHIFEEKTFPEIAKQHHATADTLRKDFARAMQKLRTWIMGTTLQLMFLMCFFNVDDAITDVLGF
jgi:RNA polymerase sigma-70 factor (ECF subfamily)